MRCLSSISVALLTAGCFGNPTPPDAGTDDAGPELCGTAQAECVPGSSQSCGCSNMGNQTCGDNCGWGACDGDMVGTCSSGDTQPCTDVCGNSGTQSCTATCTWGDCHSTQFETCQPAQTQSCTDPCSNAGVQTCTTECYWGNCLGSSSGACVTCDPSTNVSCPNGQICKLSGVCGPPAYSESNGTVSDSSTGLIWQQTAPSNPCPQDGPNGCTWPHAVQYCQSLTLNSLTWRLPTVEELFSLVQTGGSPTIDATAFPGTPNAYFWTNVESGVSSEYPWQVGFLSGDVRDEDVTNIALVRCVH